MKMNYFFISCVLMMLLTGCASASYQTPPALEGVKKGECSRPHRQAVVRKLRPRTVKPYRLIHSSYPQREKPFQQPAKKIHKKTTPMLTDGFATVTYHVDQQPVIHTAPFQITVIQLEPGETFTNISSGDPSRWSYAVAVSGKEETAQQNILVKPSVPEISTNLVITTDKRLYNLRLIATETDSPTRSVDFWYPEEQRNEREETIGAAEEPIEAISCCKNTMLQKDHYRITPAGFFHRPPPWQPVRVLNVGEKTLIQFPDNIAEQDLPALFVINGGQKACVNYRFQSPYMMVDKRLEEAMLVSGVSTSQEAVMLTHFFSAGRNVDHV